MHFVTLWPFDLIFTDGRGIVMMPSLVILLSAVLVLSCGQTDRQTDRHNERITDIAILTRLPSAWVSVLSELRQPTCSFEVGGSIDNSYMYGAEHRKSFSPRTRTKIVWELYRRPTCMQWRRSVCKMRVSLLLPPFLAILFTSLPILFASGSPIP